MYLQRRRKIFLFIIFQVKLLINHDSHAPRPCHLHVTSFSKILITYLGISKCSRPVKLGPVYGLRIRLIFQTQSSVQYCPARDGNNAIMFGPQKTYIGSAISIETPPVGFFLKFSNV
jgi:hypothetical protein